MKRPLRSNFEPGSTRWAVRRAQWLAMGLTEEDLEKPKIAVVNSSSKLSVCFQHLDGIASLVADAVRGAGGLPLEIRTVAPSDFVTSAGRQGRYLMPTRDLLVNDVEVQVEGAELDGMVLLSSCDKTTPAHLMAAARLNIPSIIVTCGYQLGGHCKLGHVDIEEVYNSVGAYKAGQISLGDLAEMSRHAIQGPGVCAGLATANTMQCMAEALGMALPGSAPIRAGGERLEEMARLAGARIIPMVEEGLLPRAILTREAFRNALTVAIALGGSVNLVRHLIAAAMEAELGIDLISELENLSRTVPLIARIRPNGPVRIEDFDAAGGCAGAMKQLSPLLALDALTVTGASVLHNLAHTGVRNPEILRPLDRPVSPEPGLIVLRGNLAPDGAIVKLAAVPKEVRMFSGLARVYEDENTAIAALAKGAIKAGEVIVLRMMGVKGGPGTVFAASFMAALVGAGLGAQVAVVTDGELSGLNSGITIGQVMPEAAEGGPLAAVHSGDLIDINLNDRRIDIGIPAAELSARLASLPPRHVEAKPGWLRQYAELVQPLSKGAVLGRRDGI
jgi:dihydroxy-acid dehydratase